jgi:hypothetical protein
MAISSFPAALNKRNIVTLTSGTSWTVPAGVTAVNVTLFGGGGGSGGVCTRDSTATSGGTGGTTTFTGATSATGGSGSSARNQTLTTDPVLNYASLAGIANTGVGAFGTAGWYFSGGLGYPNASQNGRNGQVISSNVSTTPGASISYAIGAGGTAGASGSSGLAGAAGGSGSIEIEYWV